MKKIILSLFCLSISTQALALPVKADTLISYGMSNIQEFLKEIVESSPYLYFPSFDSVAIERRTPTEELRKQCKEYSRSGSFIRVTLNPSTIPISYMFSTKHQPEDLKLCTEQIQ